ncbi:NadR [Pelobium manganitolerans]|uniref:NadR n=1 Tax=Pelobium manganitolerans TaxID=1842495 RepID=A0A419SBA0_9SPHI|nr:ATP-binding protein [Pelobium manganitolerans]RKD20078.1 NadR [Pelobium manganitolerans]
MENNTIKIAVVGPESTGKSTIASALAQHFNTLWVPEYSRFYCENLNRAYTLQDELNMFYGQLALEKAVSSINKDPLLFCDTTILTVKIWSDELFGHTPPEVLNRIKTLHYDFYILLKNDLPWQDDPLRDFKGRGDYFMEVWRKELQALNAQFAEVGGTTSRLANAIAAAEQFLDKSSNTIII